MYDETMNWTLESAKLLRPFGTEAALCCCWGGEDEVQPKDVVLGAAITFYTDMSEEAGICLNHSINVFFNGYFHLPETPTTCEELNNM